MRVGILGSGHIVPGAPVASATLDARLGLLPGTLESVTGVRSRHFSCGESQIDLSRAAALRALDDANLAPSDVDLVVSAAGIPYQTLPSTAPLIQRALGIADGQAAAFDVNSTCLSFMTGLETAFRAVQSGQSDVALVIAADLASRALPWEKQPDVAALFGDGAAAVVVGRCPTGDQGVRISATMMRTYPSAYEACEIAAGGTRFDFHADFESFAAHTLFRMDGKALFRITRRHFNGFVDALLARAGWSKADVDVVVPHQASPHALAHLASHVGFDAAKLIDITRTYGNQIAASLPTALDVARKTQRIGSGARVLLLGTSAGVSFGGMALEF